MQRQHGRKIARTRGFSIIELLVAIIIIGILAAILIPIVANRSDQARRARAESDLERIGDALERAAIDTAFYPRLFMLDDTSASGLTTTGAFNRDTSADPVVDARKFNNVGMYGGATSHQNTNQLFIDPATGDLVTTAQGFILRTQMETNETEFNWNGPYITFQDDSNFYQGDTTALPDQIPDDPWGNNYLLFTRNGLVLEPEGVLQSSGTAYMPPNTVGAILAPVDVFDRLTIVSLGPNGLPGDGSVGAIPGTGDDLVRQVGR
ncbi:MAG: ral secretion pathway protein [Candidatus Sumerlaeota bacterium]|nr:ral secretion pathway protein [Candidatus Sumerlaeota bacterium]